MIALFIALAAGLYWMSGAAQRIPTKRFTIYFQKQSLEGLQMGSQVRMQGVKVGRVVDYDILPNAAHTVRVVIEVDKRAPVLEGAQAVVTRNLVTGLAGLDINNVGRGGKLLTHAPRGEPYPVIAEGVPSLTRVTGLLESLGGTGHETLTRINALLSERNRRTFSETLDNTRILTGELAATVPELRSTLVEARQAVQRVDGLADTVEATLTNVGRDVDDITTQSHQTLSAARQALEQARGELEGVSVKLKLSADLAGQDLQATSQSLRQTARSVQRSAQAFSEPSQILFGPPKNALGPGEGGQ